MPLTSGEATARDWCISSQRAPNSPWRSWNKPLHNKPRSNLLEVKRKDMLLHTWAFRSQKPEMTSVPKRRGTVGNVAKRRLVPLISKQFEVPRQKCFDWCCQDVEGWRTQKEKDRQRQKKSRAKNPAAQNAAKAPGGATRCPNLIRKICSLCRLRTIWKRAKATKRNLSWKRARRSVENVLKLLKQAKAESKTGLQGAINLFQPWFLVVSFGLKWFSYFRFPSFRIKILRSQFLCCFEVYFHFL